MLDFTDGLIAEWCDRRAEILLWRRQKLLCHAANARYRVCFRDAKKREEDAPF